MIDSVGDKPSLCHSKDHQLVTSPQRFHDRDRRRFILAVLASWAIIWIRLELHSVGYSWERWSAIHSAEPPFPWRTIFGHLSLSICFGIMASTVLNWLEPIPRHTDVSETRIAPMLHSQPRTIAVVLLVGSYMAFTDGLGVIEDPMRDVFKYVIFGGNLDLHGMFITVCERLASYVVLGQSAWTIADVLCSNHVRMSTASSRSGATTSNILWRITTNWRVVWIVPLGLTWL